MSENKFYKQITPPPAEHFLKRPAIEELLKNAFAKPLTTVVAGAGYGKTQAVLAALNALPCHWAWLHLSELDNHIDRFWERIANALKPHSRNLYDSLMSLGYPESIAAFDQFLYLLSRELTQKDRFILVFDDFHLIHNQTILNFTEWLIAGDVQRFSVVLIARKKPNLSLAGMLSKGRLSRITEGDLRFSKEEMDAYFYEMGVVFSAGAAAKIYTYTDGWIFAICLVGLAAQKGYINNENPVLTAKIDIFDLIEKEIFQVSAEEVQIFLIKLAILDVIPAGLLRELAEDAPELIGEVMQFSLFIYYDSLTDSYRIHYLFKEFLLEKKGRLAEADILKVHLKAAQWQEKNGRKSEAIGHYKECGCYQEIFAIILSYNYHVAKETADLFISLITEAPVEAVQKRPIMRVVKAIYMFNNNRIDEAKQELLTIRNEYEALSATAENLEILGEVYIVLALISIVNVDYEFEALFQKADQCLPKGSKLFDDKFNIADGLNVCSIKHPTAGELKKHREALFRTAVYANKVMNGCGYGMEYLNVAESSLYTADLKNAEKYAYKAIYQSRQYQQYDIEYMANFVLVRIFTAKGNYEKVFDILTQMKKQLQVVHIPHCLSLYDVIKGWFYVKIGISDKVPKWIKYEEETRKILPPVRLGREYLVRSDCLLAEERYYELLAFMEQTDKMYRERSILFAVIQNKITGAIIYHYLGNHIKSINMLNEAYKLAYPNDLIMQFVEYGNKMRTLTRAARQNENCQIPGEWLNKIHTKSSTYAKQLARIVSAHNAAHAQNGVVKIKLSKREAEALTSLGRGLTREEIAESCYLSLNTVNDILKNVYDKLGAFNAADAVRIAKEKDLL